MKDIPAEQFSAETAAMAEVLARGSFAAALQENNDLVHESVGVNFAAEAAPHAGAWPPRKKIGDGHPLLRDTLKLFQSATGGAGSVNEVSDREAATGVDRDAVPYAAAQNYGYPENNLPKREFEDVDDATLDRMAARIADRGIELLMEG